MAGEQGIAWMVETHEHKERSTDWYWGLGLGALAGAAVSVFLGNVLLALILLIGAGSIGYLAFRGPRQHRVAIDERGVSIDGTLYPYESIHSYWVTEERLFLTTSGLLAPHLSVPLDDAAHAQAVHNFLGKRLPEEEQHPYLGEHLAELLGL